MHLLTRVFELWPRLNYRTLEQGFSWHRDLLLFTANIIKSVQLTGSIFNDGPYRVNCVSSHRSVLSLCRAVLSYNGVSTDLIMPYGKPTAVCHEHTSKDVHKGCGQTAALLDFTWIYQAERPQSIICSFKAKKFPRYSHTCLIPHFKVFPVEL